MSLKTVVCHTEGCPNNGIPLIWDYDTAAATAAANDVTLSGPGCGGCSTPFTDITDTAGASPGTGGFAPAADTGTDQPAT